MHRIASLGDMQETNKNERHGTSHRNAPWDPDDEYKAALVDFGHLFEWIAKHTVVPVVNATWQSAAGIYHLVIVPCIASRRVGTGHPWRRQRRDCW